MKAFQAKNRRIIKCIHETNPRKRADAAAAHDRSIFLKAKQKVEQSPGWRENRCKSRCKRRLFPVRVPVSSAATIDGWGWGGRGLIMESGDEDILDVLRSRYETGLWCQIGSIHPRRHYAVTGQKWSKNVLVCRNDTNGKTWTNVCKKNQPKNKNKKTTEETLALFFNLPGRQSYSINSIVDL